MSDNAVPAAVVLAWLLLATSAVAGAPPTSVLGNDGEVYQLKAARYGELFPGGIGAAAETPVLAVDVTSSSGAQRLLVPTTEVPDAEVTPFLVYDKDTGVLAVVWDVVSEGRGKTRLATLGPQGWSDTAQVAATVGPATAAWSAVTHDSYEIQLDAGESVRAERSIIHIVRQVPDGDASRLLYTPVILAAGRYVGWSETFDLGDVYAAGIAGESEPGPLPKELPPGLRSAFYVQVSSDRDSLLVAFGNPRDGRVTVLEIRILPLELAYLSDRVRDAVLAATTPFDPVAPGPFAEDMRATMIGMGARFGFHPGIVKYVADEIDSWLRASASRYSPATLDQLAADLRAHTIDVVSSLFGRSLRWAFKEAGSTTIEIDVGGTGTEEEATQPAQILDVRAVFSRPAPTLDAPAAHLAVSPDGREVAIYWQNAEGTRLNYLESSGEEGWSAPKSLALGEELSAEAALGLLELRLR